MLPPKLLATPTQNHCFHPPPPVVATYHHLLMPTIPATATYCHYLLLLPRKTTVAVTATHSHMLLTSITTTLLAPTTNRCCHPPPPIAATLSSYCYFPTPLTAATLITWLCRQNHLLLPFTTYCSILALTSAATRRKVLLPLTSPSATICTTYCCHSHQRQSVTPPARVTCHPLLLPITSC